MFKRRIEKVGEKVSKQAGKTSLTYAILTMLFKLTVLAIGVMIVLFPFYFMLSTSLMTDDEVTDNKAIHLAPETPIWSNFKNAFQEGYVQALYLTAIITASSIILKIIITMLMGYAFAMPKWRGKRIAWWGLLSLMMLPEVALMSGQFNMVTKLGMREGIMLLVSLSLPFLASVFSALMFKNAFEAIPERTKEAAIVDGASEIKYFIRVAMPMVTPTTWTVGILTAFAAWNSYMWPALLLGQSSSGYHVMSTWLFSTGRAVDPNDPVQLKVQIRMAAAIIAILPMFIAYFAMRGRIMKAISRQGSAIKG